MSDLRAQRRLAADVLDVGKNRVWFDPDRQGDIVEAITREDIRELVQEGAIRTEEASGNSRGRARERGEKRSYGHRKGHWSRKGTAGARQNEKEDWNERITAQRQRLWELRADGTITAAQYRDLYNRANGGEFEDVERLESYVRDNYGDN